MSILIKIDDRVRLIEMPEDPDPIEPGSEGTVTSITDFSWSSSRIIGVNWDSGRKLNLVENIDKFEVID